MLQCNRVTCSFFRVSGDLQDGWVRDEDARRRVDPGEADRQDFPPDGPEQGRETVPGGVHRGRQE